MCQLENKDDTQRRNKQGFTYDEALELTGHGRYQHLLLAACCIISNAVALDMFGFSIVVAAASCDLRLGLSETGLLASAPFAGVVFAFPWGYYADVRGRRRALLCSCAGGFLFAALSSLAPCWQLMLALKALASSFSSAGYTLTATLVGESTGGAGGARRSRALFIMSSANLLAECLSFGLGYFLLPAEFGPYIPLLDIRFRPWRLFTLLLALPMGVGGLLIYCLHESPKFLASRGDTARALHVLRSIHSWNGGKGDYAVERLAPAAAVLQQASLWRSLVQQTVPIFKPPLLWRTLQLFYLMAICATTNNAFVMWYPTIVNIFFKSLSTGENTERTFCERLFNENSSMTPGVADDVDYVCDDTLSALAIVSGVVYGLFFCAVTLGVSALAARRRTVLLASLLVSGVSGMLVEVRQAAASLAFFVLLQSSIIGMPSLAGYCVDLYPTAYRGLVSSLGMMAARLCSLAGVNLVGAVLAAHCHLTLYVWPLFVFSGILVALLLPSDSELNRELKESASGDRAAPGSRTYCSACSHDNSN